MSFKVNDKIVYPIHGVGTIVDKFESDFQDKTISYYKILFDDSSINISVPVDVAEQMGLRKPLAKKTLKASLNSLGKKTRLSTKDIGEINMLAQEKVSSGDLFEIIETINILITTRERRKKEGKKLSTTSKNILSQACKFLRSEVTEVLGTVAVKDYEIDD